MQSVIIIFLIGFYQCTNPYYTDNVVVVKRNTHNTLFFGKNNTHSNFKSFSPSKLNIISKVNNVNYKSFSTSKIDIESKINKVEAQIDNVTKKIETIESQLSIITSPSDVYTKDELKEEKKDLRDKEKSLQSQLLSLFDKLPKGINIYKCFYFIIYVISSTFLLYNLIASTHFYNI
jgi:hypothetical protein